MAKNEESGSEALFDKALALAESTLDKAASDAGEIGDYLTLAMIEAAVNRAVDIAGPEDIADMLRDLAEQIENGEMDEDEDDDSDEEDEDEPGNN